MTSKITTLFLCFFLIQAFSLEAQKGYHLKIELKNYQDSFLILGFHYGEKQYIKDSAMYSKPGVFEFKADTLLPTGVYVLHMPKRKEFIQLLIPDNQQQITITGDVTDPINTLRFKTSKDNDLFYQYMRFIAERRTKAAPYQAQMEALKDSVEKEKIQKILNGIDQEVKDEQLRIVKDHKGTMTAMVVNAYIIDPLPEFKGDDKTIQEKRYFYFMDHYFDRLDFSDPRIIRTPFIFPKLDDYVNKHTVTIPDSVNVAIDRVLKLCKPNAELYKYFLVHFLNQFAKSNIIGMDAVYVYIVENYYAKGEAPWTDEEQLKKITENAATLKPILIGKPAPPMNHMLRSDSTFISLHDIKSPYTVLVFWDTECGHCKKEMPTIIKFYDKWKSKGVEVFAVCTKVMDKVGDCWKAIQERDMMRWINVTDPYLLSKYKQNYDVRYTPQIFILDYKKEILFKRLAAEQLDKVMEDLLKREEFLKKENQNRHLVTDPVQKVSNSKEVGKSFIKMDKNPNGTFTIPCKVNGLALNFILDTGASSVSISATEALFMLKNGYLSPSDLIGKEYFSLANGEIEEGTIVNIKSLQFGNFTLNDIEASITHNLKGPLLLGQSALSKLGKVEIDYQKDILTIMK